MLSTRWPKPFAFHALEPSAHRSPRKYNDQRGYTGWRIPQISWCAHGRIWGLYCGAGRSLGLCGNRPQARRCVWGWSHGCGVRVRWLRVHARGWPSCANRQRWHPKEFRDSRNGASDVGKREHIVVVQRVSPKGDGTCLPRRFCSPGRRHGVHCGHDRLVARPDNSPRSNC